MEHWLERLQDPTFPFTVQQLSSLLLPLTGTLLGLVYAGLIYWFQGALDRLTYSRGFLEEILAAHGKVLLDLLVGASLLALFSYFSLELFATVSFWGFATLLAIDLLHTVAQQGYYITIFSTKVIPAGYGPVRSFLRKLWNAGPVGWWAGVAPFGLTVLYPVWVNSRSGFTWVLSEQAVIATLLTTTAVSLLRIRSLLVEAIGVRKEVEKHLESANDERIQKLEQPVFTWDRTKQRVEREIVREHLKSINLNDWIQTEALKERPNWDSTMLQGTPVLFGLPSIGENGQCHINIYVPHFSSDEETRRCIFAWARRILETLAQSQSDVSRYTLSFFRKDSATESSHFAMIRAARADVVQAVQRDGLSDDEFVRLMPGRYFSLGVA